MSPEAVRAEAKPAIQNLTRERYRAARDEQRQRLDALWKRRAELYNLPGEKLPEEVLDPRKQALRTRLQRYLEVDPHGVDAVRSSKWTTWTLEYKEDKENNVTGIDIKGYTSYVLLETELRISLRSDRLGHSAGWIFATNIGSRHKYFHEEDTERAMRLAEEYLDALLAPVEKAVGLSPIPKPDLLQQFYANVDER